MTQFTRHFSAAGFALLILLLPMVASPTDAIRKANAADWPQFLGPDRNGISTETGLIDSWPEGGPREVWRVKGGIGMTGVAVKGDTACTMIQTDGQQRLLALNSETGATKWSTPVAPAYENGQGDGPRATQTIVGEAVIVFTGDGTLARVKLSDGAIEWSHNVLKRHGGRPADYGMACSPLVVSDLVIVKAGATAGPSSRATSKPENLAGHPGKAKQQATRRQPR